MASDLPTVVSVTTFLLDDEDEGLTIVAARSDGRIFSCEGFRPSRWMELVDPVPGTAAAEEDEHSAELSTEARDEILRRAFAEDVEPWDL